MTNDLLRNAFQVSNVIEHQGVTDVGQANPDKDFEDTRANLVRMMAISYHAIQSLSILADQSQSPDAFDVLNKHIKTYNEAQEQLLRHYKHREREDKKAISTSNGNIIDNSVTQQIAFHGTPAEMLAAYEASKIKKID